MIAILMATFNGEKFLSEQIDSIIKQTYHDWSLFIRDDGSSDNTLDIINTYIKGNHNIHLIQDDYSKKGAKWNFMHLLELIDADYYMFCDQDDVWHPNKVSRELSEIQKIEKPGVPALVCSDLCIVDQFLQTIDESFWRYMKLRPSLLVQKRYAISCNLFTGCTMMFNNKAKEISLPFTEYMMLHDYWVGLNVIAHDGAIGAIPEQLILYRQHQNNVCGAQPIGKSFSYYIRKVISIGKVIRDYKEKFLMANNIYNGKVNLFYFLFNRFVYLAKR